MALDSVIERSRVREEGFVRSKYGKLVISFDLILVRKHLYIGGEDSRTKPTDDSSRYLRYADKSTNEIFDKIPNQGKVIQALTNYFTPR